MKPRAKANPSLAEQERTILDVYVDMIENGDIDDMFDLMHYAKINPHSDRRDLAALLAGLGSRL